MEVEKGNGKTCEEGGGGGSVLGSLSELDFCISLLAILSHTHTNFINSQRELRYLQDELNTQLAHDKDLL